MRHQLAYTGFPRPALKRKRSIHWNDKLPLTAPGFMCSIRHFFHLPWADAVRCPTPLGPRLFSLSVCNLHKCSMKMEVGDILSGIYVVHFGKCVRNIYLNSRLRTQSDGFPLTVRDRSITLCIWARRKNLERMHLVLSTIQKENGSILETIFILLPHKPNVAEESPWSQCPFKWCHGTLALSQGFTQLDNVLFTVGLAFKAVLMHT